MGNRVTTELNPLEWSNHTLDVLTALGTVGAVAVAASVALLGWLVRASRESRRAPQLAVSYDPASDLTRESIAPGGLLAAKPVPAGYARIGVTNGRGRRAAHDVEVLVVRVRWLVRGNKAAAHEGLIGPRVNLGPLAWTHSAPPSLAIGPGVLRTVDVAIVGLGDHHATLGLLNAPLSGAHKLVDGTYEVTLAIGGSDVDAEHYELTLEFERDWDGEEETLRDHLAITDWPRKVRPPTG